MSYILVADDEPLNQAVFEEMLVDRYELKIVGDGLQCLDSVAERRPDLILLDIAMPNVDGIEVCSRLRSDENTRDIPIILVSAYASKTDKQKGMDVGANDYVSKPFDIADFLQKIADILGD